MKNKSVKANPENRIHYPLVMGVVNALRFIFQDLKKADKVIEYSFKNNPKWGARDRAFIAETVYEIVRYWRYYWHLLQQPVSFENTQLMQLVGIYLLENNIELPDWKEFKILNKSNLKAAALEVPSIAIKASISDELYNIATKELGSKFDKELNAMNNPAKVVLRVNTLKADFNTVKIELQKQQINTIVNVQMPTALILAERQNIFNNVLYKNGSFEIQDAGSQLIAPYLDVLPGMKVIDACAGAGGKSLHLSCLMKNKGRIIALDTESYKLEELTKRSRRNGVSIIETRTIENNKTIKRLADSADRLLLDVPCTGLGVLRRNPDAKYKIGQEFLQKILTLQQSIIQNYASMLKVGGKMVYATCSLLPSENEHQVNLFLENNKNYKLIKQCTVYPSEYGFDGFFMAQIEKLA